LLKTIIGDLQLVPELSRMALEFDGIDDWIQIPDSDIINTGGKFLNRTVIVKFNASDAANIVDP
jgi:hypothetical protein